MQLVQQQSSCAAASALLCYLHFTALECLALLCAFITLVRFALLQAFSTQHVSTDGLLPCPHPPAGRLSPQPGLALLPALTQGHEHGEGWNEC